MTNWLDLVGFVSFGFMVISLLFVGVFLIMFLMALRPGGGGKPK